ncbi:MAG: adenylate/guanylate cyclase domain-containing protein [Acidobacteria bacterium]|nr:adenylate/guanylate cyclase domain-containing protein [Acidobacteriota bacterium]
MAQIVYQNEAVVEETDLSLSLLDVSHKHGIPHTQACGGNARCSTCRVLVLENLEHVCPRNEAEALLASRRGFTDDIRLACQSRIDGDVTIRRLVVDDFDESLVSAETPMAVGRESCIAVLFSDIRGFTPFTERTLPYDVVHILNRYFQAVGDAVIDNGGVIDKYIGDAVMALFGLAGADPRTTCLQAVRAGLAMRDAVREFNGYLERVFHETFAIGIGIHFGPAIVGEIGHSAGRQMTAIGNTVNVASRIESESKVLAAELVVSEYVVAQLGDAVRTGQSCTTNLRGTSGETRLFEVLSLAGEPAGVGDDSIHAK